jgi:hypothetical protein
MNWLLATKAYLQKFTDPKLSKDKPISTSYAREDTMNKASVSKMRCGVWGVNFVFLTRSLYYYKCKWTYHVRKSTASKRTPHASHSNHPECSVGRGKNVAADLESMCRFSKHTRPTLISGAKINNITPFGPITCNKSLSSEIYWS